MGGCEDSAAGLQEESQGELQGESQGESHEYSFVMVENSGEEDPKAGHT